MIIRHAGYPSNPKAVQEMVPITSRILGVAGYGYFLTSFEEKYSYFDLRIKEERIWPLGSCIFGRTSGLLDNLISG